MTVKIFSSRWGWLLSMLSLCAPPVAVVTTADVAHASGETITVPASPHLLPNTADQDPGDVVIDGFGPASVINVGVSLDNPPSDTTFRFSSTTGLTPNYGYVFTSSLQAITFTGTEADANTALASLLISTGTIAGPATLNVTATLAQANTYYDPLDDSFYQYVASPSITFANARASALTRTFNGATGYLANIMSATENDFIKNNVNAPNIWIGASDNSVEGTWSWVDGPEAGLTFWQGTATGGPPTGTNWFSNWAPSEPNDSGGNEDGAVTNWRGTLGRWNDIGSSSLNFVTGYLVEFSTPIGGYTGVATQQMVAIIDYEPRNVTTRAGDTEVVVTWDEPEVATVTGYTVTASPDGRTCIVTGSTATGNTCTVTGLTNGTTYSFTVTAQHAWGSSDSPSPPATPSGQAGTTSTTTTTSSPLPITGPTNDGGGTFALWALTIGLGVVVIARRRQRI